MISPWQNIPTLFNDKQTPLTKPKSNRPFTRFSLVLVQLFYQMDDRDDGIENNRQIKLK